MPSINIAIGKLSADKKKEIIEKVSQLMSETTNIPLQAFTVFINEYERESIGVGGVPLSELQK
ncbi:MAG: 4-oxalocrotonate tautomerase DmpI [Bacillota bacterium]|jgi:4-oxalocrotonate tautomerase